ncbi:hypothetical protein KGF54_002541 [Candida jiufengensis]|uniref:uncharacterized protein n=1 Tax=Candida jiufengensis TaxID=497108 RepID=UPI0022246ED1|nr:uncharacterized protein KGF54_002541 [Candida jiufengensis]KAI5953170.1 hypothetical protein KGF54_002541 [Candida jiufengensis]
MNEYNQSSNIDNFNNSNDINNSINNNLISNSSTSNSNNHEVLQPNSRLTNFFKNNYNNNDNDNSNEINNSNNTNDLNSTIPNKNVKIKLTNKHTKSKIHQNKKKRNITSRACDACAIRKVKCDPNTPCGHCLSNNLICTRIRIRKKSGPKTLTNKTLESINNLSEVIEINSNKNQNQQLQVPQHDNKSRPEIHSKASSSSATNQFSKSPSFIEDEMLTSAHSLTPPISNRSSIAQSLTPNEQALNQQQQQQQNQQQSTISTDVPINSYQETINSSTSAITTEDYLVTPYHLIENLRLIGDEPAIYELIKPLIINTVLTNYSKLIQFLESNYPNNSNSTHNPHLSEINLINHHEDSLYLSNLLIILTLNQIIAEFLIKFKKTKFKHLTHYSKKKLMFNPFKNFKNLCHFKVLEILTLIEKNLIVPPIIPKIRADKTTQKNESNQSTVFFNLSQVNFYLASYYNILNLTNTLNSTNESNNSYGNEAQENQKIIYMNKAITFFQLISIKERDDIKPVKELYELIFTFERYFLVFSSFTYGFNIFKNNNILLKLRDKKFESENKTTLFQLMNFCDDMGLMDDICKHSSFNALLNFNKIKSIYYDIKSKLLNLSRPKEDEYIEKILIQVILFKILIIKPLNFENCKKEIFEIMNQISFNLEKADNDIFKVKISNYQILQPLLHILKIFLELKQVEVKLNSPINLQDQNLLVRYSELLIIHLPFFNNINKLIRAHKILNNWFLMLSEIKKDESEIDQQQFQEQEQLKDQQTQVRLLQEQPNQASQQQQQETHQYNPLQSQQIPQTPITDGIPLHTGITPQSQTQLQSLNQLSFTNLSHIQSQQRIASQIDINELLRNFNSSSNQNLHQILVNPISATQYKADDEEDDEKIGNKNQEKLEVDDDDNEDEEDEANDFFSIKPKNEHGHKFITSDQKQQQQRQQQNFQLPMNISTSISQQFPQTQSIINLNNLSNSSTKSFLSLLNAANYIEDEANFNLMNSTGGNNSNNNLSGDNNGSNNNKSLIGDSSFFNLNNLG